MKATKAGKTIDQANLVNQMIDANKNLILYGSDDVVKTYHKFFISAQEKRLKLDQLGEIIISIRQDMGNSKTKITSEDVLQFIVDYKNAKAK